MTYVWVLKCTAAAVDFWIAVPRMWPSVLLRHLSGYRQTAGWRGAVPVGLRHDVKAEREMAYSFICSPAQEARQEGASRARQHGRHPPTAGCSALIRPPRLPLRIALSTPRPTDARVCTDRRSQWVICRHSGGDWWLVALSADRPVPPPPPLLTAVCTGDTSAPLSLPLLTAYFRVLTPELPPPPSAPSGHPTD